MTDAQPRPDVDWFPLPVPVPGPTAYTELGLRPDATAEEIRVATARRVRALKVAHATQDELADFHAASLTRTDHRAAYDEDHPPCALLRLEPAWNPIFDDAEFALTRLRHDLASFLLAQDEPDRPIPFPRTTDLDHGDLDRGGLDRGGLDHGDFAEDFRSNPLLDRKDIG